MAREGDVSCAEMTTVSQLRKTEEEEVELRIPRSFDYGDHGGGAAHETPGARTVDPFDAVLPLAPRV